MTRATKTGLAILVIALVVVTSITQCHVRSKKNKSDEKANSVQTVKAVSYAAPKQKSAEVSYTVEHYKQNLSDGNFTKVESESLRALPGTTSKAENWSYQGFTTLPYEQQPVAEDGSTVIKIYYKRNHITYRFNLAGGLMPQKESVFEISGLYGEKIRLATPKKAGYVFSSWNPELPERLGESDYTSYTATYVREGDYAIHYELSGGENNALNPASYNVETPTITLHEPTRNGYTFAGWTQGTAKEKEPATLSMQIPRGSTGELYIQAHWLANSFTVTFDANGGSCPAVPVRVTYEMPYGELPVAERTGYTFAGWQNEQGRDVVSSTTMLQRKDHTLRAHWIPNMHTMTFIANGGEGEQAVFSGCPYNTEQRLPESMFTRTGYTFKGWTERPRLKGNPLFASGDMYLIQGDVRLYAQWQPVNYHIHFEANGGNGTMQDQNFVYDTGFPLKDCTFTRLGWYSAGWSTDQSDTEPQYKAHEIVKNLASKDNETITLYAVWKQPRVLFNANGGYIRTTEQTVDYKLSYPLESAQMLGLKREGYSFTGWATGKSKAQIAYKDGDKVTLSEDTVLTALWKANPYTVSFSTGDSIIEKRIVQYDASYGTLPSPKKDEYTFGGWYSSLTFSDETRVTERTAMKKAGNSTLYARWHKNPVITFNANGGLLQKPVTKMVGYNSPGTLTSAAEMGLEQSTSQKSQLKKQAETASPIADFAYIQPGAFGGWSTSPDGTGDFYADGGEITLIKDTTLYAQWKGFIRASNYRERGYGSSISKPFYLCTHEVTQEEYEQYCTYGGNAPSPQYGKGASVPTYYISWYDTLVYCNARSLAEGLTPVYSIEGKTNPKQWKGIALAGGKLRSPTTQNAAWDAVKADFNANGYRLPTEAEWQYAALGGWTIQGGNGYDDDVFSGYNGTNAASDYVWFSGNAQGSTQRIKSKLPNSYGLYDMSGNVWEWCWDTYAPYPPYSTIDYKGAGNARETNAHVLKGGSWSGSAGGCSVSRRISAQAQYQYYYYGFRVARSSK